MKRILPLVWLYSLILFPHLGIGQSADQWPEYWLEKADQLEEQEQLDSAIYCLKQAANYARNSQNIDCLTKSQLKQGSCFLYQENWDSAVYYYNQCIHTAQKFEIKNSLILANAHSLQGVAYYYLGDFNQAIVHAQKSLDYDLINGVEPSNLALNLENLANMYREKSAYDKALEYYQQAMAIYKKEGASAKKLLGLTYLNIGVCYNRKQQNEKALAYYKRSKAQLEQNPNPSKKQLISLYNSFSIVYRDLNALDKSMNYVQKALALQKETPYKRANTLTTLGYLYLKKKLYPKAREVLMEAFEIHPDKKHPNVAKIQLTLGQSWAGENKKKKALEAYQKGMMILVQGFENTGMNNPALQNYNSSSRNLLKLLHAKAKLLSQMGADYCGLSIETYQLASDLIFQMQKSYPNASTQLLLAKTTTPLHEEGFEVAFNAYQKDKTIKNLNQALFFAERTKSKLLLDNIATKTAKKMGGVPKELIQEEQNLYLNLAFYKKKWLEADRKQQTEKKQQLQQYIFDLDARIAQLQKRLAKEYPNYYEDQQQAIPTVEVVQDQFLKSNKEVLIEYFVSHQEVYAFVIHPSFAKLEHIATKTSLEVFLSRFWASLLNPQTKMQNEEDAFKYYVINAQILYEKLLKPLIPEKVQELYIVQDEQLSFLPMAALLKSNSQEAGMSYLDLDYLVHHYRFGYSYSAALLLHNLRHKSTDYQQSFLGFAPFETVTPKDSFNALPYSLNEIEEATNLLGGNNFIGDQATFGQFCQTANASILHIASHGHVNRRYPEYSYLAFRGDQHLYAFEIQNIEIEADLVVLSACETGIGQFASGEGTLSLARSFMYTGVSSVLMTLWKIRDRSSAVLMNYLYQYLAEHGTSKLEALREAQRKYLQVDADPRTAHPYFWAAHILLGSPDASMIRPLDHRWKYAGCCMVLLIGIGFWQWKKGRG
ncbi:CHAT domain-containing protein [Aureispira anguillae]|uniref:CHAT domain-containing protein n=1 Tax=Aureispira anguillae TaxID=2864201 RepID=A0A915YBU7_9BACT|nr:CHAT domain-containing tetratricopeptide repeat protein [Aureispira anguillae]BDS10189.1 CHAT domain-containing protein [Aureispira anguillae]